VRAKVAEARVEVLRTALGEAGDALWRAGNMLSAICGSDCSADREKAMNSAFLAMGKARSALGVERGTA
jgi:hypothetical protein